MSKIWMTSDLHIGHDRNFVYAARGFENIMEHDQTLVKNWNALVGEDDTVYVLGDVLLKHAPEEDDFSYGLSVLQQLKGKLIIIRGNHDSESKLKKYSSCDNVLSAGDAALYLDYPVTKGYHFYLSHYPTLVSHEKIKHMRTALINLYGHTHQREHFYNSHPYMYCVCVDAHDMRPVLLDDIIEEIRDKLSKYMTE